MKTNSYKKVLSNFKAYLMLLMFLSIATFSNAQHDSTYCYSHHSNTTNQIIGATVVCVGSISKDSIFVSNIDTAEAPEFLYNYTSNGSSASPTILTNGTNGMSVGGGVFYDSVYVDNGTHAGQYTLTDTAYIIYNDGCVIKASSSLTVAVIQIGATVNVPAIPCHGGTSAVTVTGHITPPEVTTWLYTNNNSGVSNSTGNFNLVGGNTASGDSTYCVHVQGTVSGGFNRPAVTCDTTICFTVHQPAANPVVLHCANDTTVSSCQTSGQIATEFAAWLARFNHSGGVNPVYKRNPASPQPPAACGGTTTIIDSVYSDCQGPVTCTSHFTVTASPSLVIHCANDTTVAACQTQSAVNAEYVAWLKTAFGTGGCGPKVTNNGGNTGPSACGGNIPVVFTLTDTICSNTPKTCTATFTVTNAPQVTLHCANDTTVASCQTQSSVNAEYIAWLATAYATGGCAGGNVTNNGGATGPNACGGNIHVVFTYNPPNGCSSTTNCTKTFTVTNSPSLVINCAHDTTVACCQSQSAINAEYAAWLATASGSGGCGTKVTNNNPGNPNACGGSQLITFTVTDTICGGSKSCSATFHVTATPPLTMTAPPDTTIPGGQLQTLVCADFMAWLKEVTGGGGSGNVTITNNAGQGCPDSCNGSMTVIFTITDNTCPGSLSLTRTFTVGPCQSGFVGCTPGFWKNHVSIWKDANGSIPSCIAAAITALGPPYSGNGTINSSFASTFGLTAAQMTAAGLSPNVTLLQAISTGGGGFFMEGRFAVSGLLGGCSIVYTYSTTQVLVMVHNSIASLTLNPTANLLAAASNLNPDQCPSAGRATKRITDDILAPSDNVGITAFPNPFSNSTTIEFMLNYPSERTVVEIYNVQGARVATLYDSKAETGQTYTVQFNGDAFAQGVYYTRITTDSGYSFDKMVLIK